MMVRQQLNNLSYCPTSQKTFVEGTTLDNKLRKRTERYWESRRDRRWKLRKV